MTQKPYRDSKGGFVSRNTLVEELKKVIFCEGTARDVLFLAYKGSTPVPATRATIIRQFRIKYGIYETF